VTQARHFAQCVQVNSGTLFATAFLLTGDDAAAEEPLQDALVHIFSKWHAVASAGHPLAHVRRTVVNHSSVLLAGARLCSYIAREPRRPRRLTATDDLLSDRIVITGLLHSLSSRQRAAIVPRFFNDLPDRGIAEFLGCRSPQPHRSRYDQHARSAAGNLVSIRNGDIMS
jgi:DNA-directed RNA polymerase specialized sigma24 family protein